MASIFQEHPFNREINAIDVKRITRSFPLVSDLAASEHIAIRDYIDVTPQRFYSRPAYHAYLEFLDTTYKRSPQVLVEAFAKHQHALDMGCRILSEVNKTPIHDTYIPRGEIDRLQWIDDQINQLLLRLWEASLHGFLLIHSHVRRRINHKGLDKMDIFNTVEELKNSSLAIAAEHYDHGVRNGIGHGKVTYGSDHVSYQDKKGNVTKRIYNELVQCFDGLIDTLNGLALAYRVFFAIHQPTLIQAGLQLPKAILFDELKARVDMDNWRIETCLESDRRAPKRQLEVHLKNSFWDFAKVQYWAFYTAYWAERLTGSYESIFLQFRSTTAKFNSWAGYDGARMRELRLSNTSDIASYKGVLEGDLTFFIPRFRFPKWMLKLGTYRMALTAQYRAWRYRKRLEQVKKEFEVRHCAIHAQRRYSVIGDAVVVLHAPDNEAITQIRSAHKAIVKATITACRRSLPWYSIARYLPVRYARIMVHATDKRRRQLKHAGLPTDLIGTVGFNTSGHIKNIEILGGTLEQHGKYRLVWHSKWRGPRS